MNFDFKTRLDLLRYSSRICVQYIPDILDESSVREKSGLSEIMDKQEGQSLKHEMKQGLI